MKIENFKKIKLLILDVDGVLTDGGFYSDDSGQITRRYNALDGYGIKAAIDKGLKIVVISGGKNRSIILRCEYLGITDVFIGREDKLNVYLEEVKPKYNLTDEEVAYIGDDVYDIPLLKQVGLSITVPQAHQKVKDLAKYTTIRNGGEGAVREVIDLIMDL